MLSSVPFDCLPDLIETPALAKAECSKAPDQPPPRWHARTPRPRPLVAFEPVIEPIPICLHEPDRWPREMDGQEQNICIGDRGQKPPARDRGLLGIPVNSRGPIEFPALNRVMHHVAGHHRA